MRFIDIYSVSWIILTQKLFNNYVDDTLYGPSEVILELMATRWTYTKRPCDYTIHYKGRAISYDGNFKKLLDLFGETSDNIRMTIYFESINPFLIDMERNTEMH